MPALCTCSAVIRCRNRVSIQLVTVTFLTCHVPAHPNAIPETCLCEKLSFVTGPRNGATCVAVFPQSTGTMVSSTMCTMTSARMSSTTCCLRSRTTTSVKPRRRASRCWDHTTGTMSASIDQTDNELLLSILFVFQPFSICMLGEICRGSHANNTYHQFTQ